MSVVQDQNELRRFISATNEEIAIDVQKAILEGLEMTSSGKKKTILFVCATGIATSTVVAEKTMEFLHDHGFRCQLYTNKRGFVTRI